MATVADYVKRLYELKNYKKKETDDFEERMKPVEERIEAIEQQLLVQLNKTGAKHIATEYGTAGWTEFYSFNIVDKEAFRRHVIGAEAWELTTFATAKSACEEFYIANKETPPPGVNRFSERRLSLTAPAKPRVKKAKPEADDSPSQVESMV